jgi:single-strand DNA-binding protein
MNIFTFSGHIGRDAETRYTQQGKVVCSFSVPATSGWGDNKITTWVKCSLWGQRAESLSPYLLKGVKVVVSGEFAEKKFTKQDQSEGHSLELNVESVVIASNGQGQQQNNQQNYQPQQQQQPAQQQNHQQNYQQPHQNNERPQHQPQQQPAQQQPAQQKPAYAQPNMDFDDDIPFMNPYFREAILAV